jgi:hypothetical protein
MPGTATLLIYIERERRAGVLWYGQHEGPSQWTTRLTYSQSSQCQLVRRDFCRSTWSDVRIRCPGAIVCVKGHGQHAARLSLLQGPGLTAKEDQRKGPSRERRERREHLERLEVLWGGVESRPFHAWRDDFDDPE